MTQVFLPRDAWVLSGSVMGWGERLTDRFDAVVFLTVDPRTRVSRLELRQTVRLGETINPGEANELAHQEFLAWARGYDDPRFEGRNRRRHEDWLAMLSCPVVRLDSSRPVAQLLQQLLE
jgi:hypothetical protein